MDRFFARLGLPVPQMTPAQRSLSKSKNVAMAGAICGVIFGCLLGMTSLLFMDLDAADRAKRQKELETIFYTVMKEGHQLIEAERCGLFIVDKENNELWSKIASGMKESQRIRVKIGEGIAGKVAVTGEMVLSNDIYADDRFAHLDAGFRMSDTATGFKTRQMLCVPVKSKEDGEVIAVIQFINKTNGKGFDDHDIKLTKLLSSHVGLFIATVEGDNTD